MTIAHDALHAAIFGAHTDICPWCKKEHSCSDPHDCQRNGYCLGCRIELGDFDEEPSEDELYNPLEEV